jgi:hypothetical protein
LIAEEKTKVFGPNGSKHYQNSKETAQGKKNITHNKEIKINRREKAF